MSPSSGVGALKDRVDVVVDEAAPVDATLVRDQGQKPILVLRAWQSFDNAVDQVAALLPGENRDAVRALVRANLKGALDFDQLSAAETAPAWVAGESTPLPVRARWTRRASWLAAATFVLVAGLGYGAAREAVTEPDMIAHVDFQRFASAAGLECTEIDVDDADCRNEREGTIIVVSARPGGHGKPRTYWLRSGDQMSMLIVFDTVEEANEWQGFRAMTRLWPMLRVADRFMVGGMDTETVKQFLAAAEVASKRPPW